MKNGTSFIHKRWTDTNRCKCGNKLVHNLVSCTKDFNCKNQVILRYKESELHTDSVEEIFIPRLGGEEFIHFCFWPNSEKAVLGSVVTFMKPDLSGNVHVCEGKTVLICESFSIIQSLPKSLKTVRMVTRCPVAWSTARGTTVAIEKDVSQSRKREQLWESLICVFKRFTICHIPEKDMW